MPSQGHGWERIVVGTQTSTHAMLDFASELFIENVQVISTGPGELGCWPDMSVLHSLFTDDVSCEKGA